MASDVQRIFPKRKKMVQRAVDTIVLGFFSALYSCAVLVLKLRTRKPPANPATQAR